MLHVCMCLYIYIYIVYIYIYIYLCFPPPKAPAHHIYIYIYTFIFICIYLAYLFVDFVYMDFQDTCSDRHATLPRATPRKTWELICSIG